MVNLPTGSDNFVDTLDGNILEFYFGMERVGEWRILLGRTAESDKFLAERASKGLDVIVVFHGCL